MFTNVHPRLLLTRLWFIRISFIVFLLWSNVRFIHSPASRSESWFRDGGFILNTAENSLHGKQLYLDSSFQYGSLPITLYTFLSRFFGNTIETFSNYLLGVHIACIVLIFVVLAVARCDVTATLLIVLALYPFCVRPLGLQNSYEQLCTLAVIALWQPPTNRKPGRSVLLGLLLGVMQWVRFGSAGGPIIGFVAVDLLSAYTQSQDLSKGDFRKLVIGWVFALGGFLMAEGGLLMQLFVTLPGDMARDVAWPFYMTRAFSAYAPEDLHLRWLTLNYFLGNQLGAAVAFVCAAFCFLALWFSSGFRRTSTDVSQTGYRLLIPFVAYLFNAAFYYQQVWHYYIGFWHLALAAGYYLRLQARPERWAVALLFLPGAYVALRSDFRDAPVSQLVMTVSPRGERLWLPPEVVARTQNLTAALAAFQSKHSSAQNNAKGVIILERQPITVASHLHFFYLIPQVIRHTMIFPGWLRPRDLVEMEQAIQQGETVVLLQKPEQGPPPRNICLWNTYSFPKEFCDRVSGLLLDPIPVDGASWIFPVRTGAPRT
jgi:hypothetical protein